MHGLPGAQFHFCQRHDNRRLHAVPGEGRRARTRRDWGLISGGSVGLLGLAILLRLPLSVPPCQLSRRPAPQTAPTGLPATAPSAPGPARSPAAPAARASRAAVRPTSTSAPAAPALLALCVGACAWGGKGAAPGAACTLSAHAVSGSLHATLRFPSYSRRPACSRPPTRRPATAAPGPSGCPARRRACPAVGTSHGTPRQARPVADRAPRAPSASAPCASAATAGAARTTQT
jgi:hypothetical protein